METTEDCPTCGQPLSEHQKNVVDGFVWYDECPPKKLDVPLTIGFILCCVFVLYMFAQIIRVTFF